jgi:hypothetical protein
MRNRTALALLFSLLVIASAAAQSPGILYDNGTYCQGGCTDAWQINQGIVTSDTFFLTSTSKVTGFDFIAWEFPNDRILRIQWSITSSEFGGTTYGSGNAIVAHDQFLGLNEYGFDLDKVTVTGLDVDVPAGTYWINLQNAVTEMHEQAYWDENSGTDCHSRGCPSSASENEVGTIPSETFDIRGIPSAGGDQQSEAPKPGTLVLLTSGMLVLGVLGRRLL